MGECEDEDESPRFGILWHTAILIERDKG